MWTCRATSAISGDPEQLNEAVFLSPDGKVCRASAAETQGFETLEVYFRQLGCRPLLRQPGWKVRVPEGYKNLPGWLIRHPEPRLMRYLEVYDPAGRRTLLEFVDEAGESLYDQILTELADELTDEESANGQQRQLRDGPLSQGDQANGDGRRPPRRLHREQAFGAVTDQAGRGLGDRLQRRRRQGLEEYLRRQGVLTQE